MYAAVEPTKGLPGMVTSPAIREEAGMMRDTLAHRRQHAALIDDFDELY